MNELSFFLKSLIWEKWEVRSLFQYPSLSYNGRGYKAKLVLGFFSYALFLNSEKHYTIPNAINELSSLILSAVLIKIDP